MDFREWQEDVINDCIAIVATRTNDTGVVHVEVPTGAGKTLVAAILVEGCATYRDDRGYTRHRRCIYAVPQRTIVWSMMNYNFFVQKMKTYMHFIF
jgi:CRISPR/Cas system-associated endonuclease/helicase Cas3